MKLEIRKWVGILILLLFSVTVRAQHYTKGRYYDISNKRIDGLIKFSPDRDHIRYKADEKASDVKINIKDISAVVIFNEVSGPDSLTVMTENNKPNKRYFAQLIVTTPVRSFYFKFITIAPSGPSMSSMTTQSAATGAFTTTNIFSPGHTYGGTIEQVMYQDGNTTNEVDRHNYIEILSNAFIDAPDLAQEIRDKKYNYRHVTWLLDKYKEGKLNKQ